MSLYTGGGTSRGVSSGFDEGPSVIATAHNVHNNNNNNNYNYHANDNDDDDDEQ